MLSYQHGYHAGNFADVVKHLALTRLLAYLTLKDKPLLYLETHSGRGLYDFLDKQALKVGEFKQGIEHIWARSSQLPAVFDPYLQAIKAINPKGGLRYYPGSPALAVNMLRPEDRIYLCELHPTEFEALARMPQGQKRVHFSHSDGIASLKALLPPKEKRALIFMDPAYEIKDEYKEIPMAIKEAYKKFSTGVYCLWYPVVNRYLTDKLVRGMEDIGAQNSLQLEFLLDPKAQAGMYGCGLYLINPPFTFADEMGQVLEALKTEYAHLQAEYLIRA